MISRMRRVAGGTLRGVQGAALESAVYAASRLAARSAAAPAEPRSIFVLRNNDIGDLLIVTPLFEALRRRFPNADIVAGVGHWNLDVLRGNPHISEAIAIDAPWFNKYSGGGGIQPLRYLMASPQVADLSRRRFDVGIDVLGSAWGSLLLMRAGIPYRMGVTGYAGGHSGGSACVPFRADEHVGRMALRFAEHLGATDLPANRPQIYLSDGERAAGDRLWQSGRAPRVLIAPGAGLESKRWERENFARLIELLPDHADIILTGSQSELPLLHGLAARNARPVLTPSLREAFALVAAADVVFCNGSMMLHAAAAFSKPTVILSGPQSPAAAEHQAQWGYPGTSVTLDRLATPADAVAAARDLGAPLPSALCPPPFP